MIYAVSDLHGCYDRYRQLLDKLDLEEQDTPLCAGGCPGPWAGGLSDSQ